MPFLRDEGPPVSKETIQRARESLPLEYGFQVANETGRGVLIVRVPKAKPDYLHDLADVAFYVTLDAIRNVKDILLVGHEKTARLEPQLLRDAIRQQDREDVDLIQDYRRKLGRDYGQAILTSPSNHSHLALTVRIPKGSVTEFSPDDVKAIRDVVQEQKARFEACQFAYVIADRDHERLGRRVLLELLGATSPTATPQATGSNEVPAIQPAPAVTQTVGQRLAFPPASAPMDAQAPTPFAPTSAAAAAGLPSLFARLTAPPPPAAPPAAAPPPAPALAIAAPADIAAAPPPARAALIVDDHEEYAIISKPKPIAPPAPAAALPTAAPPSADVDVHDEYEVVSKPKAPADPATVALVPDHPEVERNVHVTTEAYEVYTSKPKPRGAPGPAITPPGQGGFQAALANAAGGGHAPARTKEYEIMGASSAPASVPLHLGSKPAAPSQAPVPEAASPYFAPPPAPAQAAPMFAPAPAPVRDDPRMQAAFMTRAPAAPAITQDNGGPVIPIVAPANPETILAQRFRDAQYEIVDGLRAQGTIFAFAAHRPNGRRVLVKRATEFGADDAPALSQLVTALGADLCIVVADKVNAGARLATWGTRIEVYTSSDVPGLTF